MGLRVGSREGIGLHRVVIKTKIKDTRDANVRHRTERERKRAGQRVLAVSATIYDSGKPKAKRKKN